MAQISIIVPVYKAEKYISAAAVCQYLRISFSHSSELGILSRVSKNCGFSGGAALRCQCLGSGGIAPQYPPCKRKSEHGFFG